MGSLTIITVTYFNKNTNLFWKYKNEIKTILNKWLLDDEELIDCGLTMKITTYCDGLSTKELFKDIVSVTQGYLQISIYQPEYGAVYFSEYNDGEKLYYREVIEDPDQ